MFIVLLNTIYFRTQSSIYPCDRGNDCVLSESITNFNWSLSVSLIVSRQSFVWSGSVVFRKLCASNSMATTLAVSGTCEADLSNGHWYQKCVIKRHVSVAVFNTCNVETAYFPFTSRHFNVICSLSNVRQLSRTTDGGKYSTQHSRPFSLRSVAMIMTREFCSQIMRQKSAVVFSNGAWLAM